MIGTMMTVPQLLEKAARNRPDKEAIYDLTRRVTYGQLQEEVERAKRMLIRLGVQKGDRVAVALPNWHETVQLFFAVSEIGAVLVPFNPSYRSKEALHILRNSGAKAVFVTEKFEEVGFEQAASLVEHIVTVRYQKEGYLSLPDLLNGATGDAVPRVEADPLDVFCLLYTSGTTGVPKGVMITHRSVVVSGMTIAKSVRCTSDDVFIILAPIFHIFGLACNLLSAIHCEAKMVLVERFKPQLALKLMQDEKVTVHHAVPSMYNLELKDPDFDKYDLSSLRVGMTGAAFCSPETVRGVREKMGMQLCISFGTTETATVTITNLDDEESKICETLGKAVEGVEVKIVNDARETLPPGEIGEIAVRGFGVMKGYYNMPEQTKEVLDEEGWYYTGDLGVMDEEGYVRFVGRKKEVIIRGGFNIYPQEIEILLQSHPKVLESAVVGLPDAVLGETVCAAIKLKPGIDAAPEEFVQYLKAYIANYKLPSRVVFVDELPATASGKVQKGVLREQLLKQLDASSC